MARNQLYRPSAIRKLPTLRFIDGREILHEDRERVEMLFVSEQRPPPGAIYFQVCYFKHIEVGDETPIDL